MQVALEHDGVTGYGEGAPVDFWGETPTNLPLDPQVIARSKGPLTDPKIGKIAHNAKYDYIVLAKYGCTSRR